MEPKIYKYQSPFTLECGVSLPKLTIAYHTYGTYSPEKKVAWVCHALTANSDAADWWKGMRLIFLKLDVDVKWQHKRT